MGAAFAVPFGEATPWPDALRELASVGWHVIGLTPQSEKPLYELTMGLLPPSPTRPERDRDHGLHARIAVVLGHEGDGLTDEALAACTTRLRIPINPAVDSLNVATAAAIALYELTLTRRT
jgi:tRNA G18 (ribose-2'-O)-methylase SpoU